MTAAGLRKPQLWRYGALLLFCGGPLLLLGLGVQNLASAWATRDLTARQQSTLSQIVTQVARHRARGLAPSDTRSMFLKSPSASLARSEIQALTTRLAGTDGGHLIEAQFTSTPEQEAGGTVAIQLSLTIDNKGLFDLLWDVESRMPLLDVTDLSVRREGDLNEGDGGGIAAGGPLRVDLTIQGHWKKELG